MNRVALSMLFGAVVTVGTLLAGIAAVTLDIPFVEAASEALLAPGFWLPEWYWGSAHDPLQFVLALTLNSFAYGLVAFACLSLLRSAKRSDRN